MGNSARKNLEDGVKQASERTPNGFYKGFFKNVQSALIMLGDRLATRNRRYYAWDDDVQNPAESYQAKIDRENHWAPTAGGGLDIPAAQRGVDRAWRTGYQNIIPIGSSDDYPPDVATSLLVGQAGPINKFFTFELTSAQQALLVPKIRIYKVLYKTEIDNTTNTYKLALPATPLPGPPEVVFDAFTKTTEVNDILINQQGKIPGVGLQSFEWSLKGVNPADVDANIEASLKIFFNNVGNVLNRDDGEGTASFLNLILFTPPVVGEQPQRMTPNPCQSDEYREEYFEIMAEVGWSAPAEALQSGLFSADQLSYIESATKAMYLQLTTHAFDFKQDGSAVLTANYRARLKLADPRHDLINYSYLEHFDERMEAARTALGDAPEASSTWSLVKGKFIDMADAAGGGVGQSGMGENAFGANATDQDVKRAIRGIEERKLAALQERYRQLVEELVTNHVYEVRIPYTLLLTDADSDGEDYTLGGSSTTESDPARVALSPKVVWGSLFSPNAEMDDQMSAFNNIVRPVQEAYKALETVRTYGPGAWVDAADAQSALLGGRRDALDLVRGDLNHGFVGDLGDPAAAVDIATLAQFSQKPAVTPDVAVVKYFYLGDLLEVLFSTGDVTQDIHNKNLAIVTTDIQFLNTFKVVSLVKSPRSTRYNTGVVTGIDMGDFKCKYAMLSEGDRKSYLSSLNVANIPISVELFLDFFKKKIVNQKKDHYYLGDFLSDMFHTFVKPVVSNNGIEGMPTSEPLAFITDVVTSKKESIFSADHPIGLVQPRNWIDGEEHEYKVPSPQPGYAGPTYTMAAPVEAYMEAANPNDHTPKIKPIFRQEKDPSQRAVVKIINLQMQFSHLDGDYHHNINRGIPNFLVGLDRGVVKSVSFKRVDQPYLRESRTAQDKTFGVSQLRELYHCDLTLYGNTLLMPGQLIYVEPNNVTFGRPTASRSAARILGLGGYHLVVDVSNVLSQQGWETKVRSLHVAMPAYSTGATT